MIKRQIPITILSLFAVWAAACGSSDKDKGSDLNSGSGAQAGAAGAGSGMGGDLLFGMNGSTDGGGIGTGPGSGGDELDASCGGSNLMAAPVPINLLVVLDRSGSMDSTPQGFTLNKWDAIRQALQGALEAQQNRLTVGLELFPHDPNTEIPLNCDPSVCCTMPSLFGDAIVVPLAAGASAVPDIVSTLGAASPGGGTPTATALDLALDYFNSAQAQALEGKKYVLLATDGGPNCNPDATCDARSCTANIDNSLPFSTNQCDAATAGPSFCLDSDRTVASATALADAGVKTIVVGIPGTEAYAGVLDQVAVAGGAPNTTGMYQYYAVTSGGGVNGLETTLRNITSQLITTCELRLESTPPDPTKVNVKIDGEFIPFLAHGGLVADAGDAGISGDGWTLDETTSPPTVVLQGAPCESVRQNGAQNVQIVFGCPRVEINIR